MCNAKDDFKLVCEIHQKMNDLIAQVMAAENEVHNLKVRSQLVELRDVLDAAKYDHIEQGAKVILDNIEWDNASYKHNEHTPITL